MKRLNKWQCHSFGWQFLSKHSFNHIRLILRATKMSEIVHVFILRMIFSLRSIGQMEKCQLHLWIDILTFHLSKHLKLSLWQLHDRSLLPKSFVCSVLDRLSQKCSWIILWAILLVPFFRAYFHRRNSSFGVSITHLRRKMSDGWHDESFAIKFWMQLDEGICCDVQSDMNKKSKK